MDGSYMNAAGTKLVRPSTSTSWNICDWDGVDVTNGTTITNNRTNLSSARFIKVDPNVDKFICYYVNTNLELCVETLIWNATSVDVVPNSRVVVESDASGVSIGEIAGSTAGLAITYENGSKGRVVTLALDNNLVATGISPAITNNNSNYAPGIAYKGNDAFQTWHNNVDCFSTGVTVGAYSTIPLKPLGVVEANGVAGDTVSVATHGVVGGFSGLISNTEYYYDVTTYNGSITTDDSGGVYIGRAVSTTELLLDNLLE